MNHLKEAKRLSRIDLHDPLIGLVVDDNEIAQFSASLAQSHALIAIAEQLRIGNLIALSNDPSYGGAAEDAESALWQIDDNRLTHLQPDIAEALGIKEES